MSIANTKPMKCCPHDSSWVTMTQLTATKTLVGYSNNSNGNLYAQILTTVDNKTVAAAPVVCNKHTVTLVYFVPLVSEDKVIAIYKTNSDVYAQSLYFNNDEIVPATPVKISMDENIRSISISQISNNKVIMCYSHYNNGSSYINAQLITLEDKSIIPLKPVELIPYSGYHYEYISTVVLSEDKVLMCFKNGNDNSMYAQVIRIIKDTITPCIPVRCCNGNPKYITLTKLKNNKVLVLHSDANKDGCLNAQILNVENENIEVSEPKQFNNEYSAYMVTVPLIPNNDKEVLLAYKSLNSIWVQRLTIDTNDNIITTDSSKIDNIDPYWINMVQLSKDKVLLCYDDGKKNYRIYSTMLTLS